MISYIKGRLVCRADTYIIVDKDGIGFNIQVSEGMLNRLPAEGSIVCIYTYMNVREDEISLFGFLSHEELKLFGKLIRVSGVGPKSAAALLGFFTVSQICAAIASDDIKLLSAGPGIGRKTAQKIILEMKDKISSIDIFGAEVQIRDNDEAAEAVQALESLGFTRAEAYKVVSAIDGENMTSGKIVSLALKALSR